MMRDGVEVNREEASICQFSFPHDIHDCAAMNRHVAIPKYSHGAYGSNKPRLLNLQANLLVMSRW